MPQFADYVTCLTERL